MDLAYDIGARGSVGWPTRTVLRTLGGLAPRRTAEWILDRMTLTERREMTAEGTRFLGSGIRIEHSVSGVSTPSYRFSRRPIEPGVDVMLVHGWNGSTIDFSSIVPPLVEAGLTVLSWDAEGHGTADGRRSDPFRLLAAFDSIVRRWGSPRIVVGHSLGAAVAVRVLADRYEDLDVRNLVVVSPSVDPMGGPGTWDGLGGERTREEISRVISTRTGLHPSVLSMPENAAAMHLSGRLSVVHDHDDEIVPLAEAYRLASVVEGSRIFLTSGHGHRGILHSREAVRTIVEGALH